MITAPRSINFFDQCYIDFFKFISNIELIGSRKRVLINMDEVLEIKTAALLILYSTIEILQIKTRDKDVVKFTACKEKRIGISLWQAGFWDMTNQSSSMPRYKSIKKELEICTASLAATQAGDESELRKVVEYAQATVLESGLDDESDLLAYNAITESVSNVWQHAYDGSFFEKGINIELARWWINVERIEDQFFIVVYDRGAGIPFTLQKKPWYKIALIDGQRGTIHSIPLDAMGIKLAVEYGQSRFKNDNRGKGLSEAKEFVQSNPQGIMLIYSGFGSFAFYSERNDTKLDELPKRFPGTLIQWNLKLETKK
ncbi:ATP-binding protein [Pseudomonas viridiflava]|uniref:ATP-binding protein n=1 Tax=Pseudomonas syringae group TaxID=136849 RepID=UPI000F043BA5|nr:hypothetical protein [Pseudomonas viridiflava]